MRLHSKSLLKSPLPRVVQFQTRSIQKAGPRGVRLFLRSQRPHHWGGLGGFRYTLGSLNVPKGSVMLQLSPSREHRSAPVPI